MSIRPVYSSEFDPSVSSALLGLLNPSAGALADVNSATVTPRIQQQTNNAGLSLAVPYAAIQSQVQQGLNSALRDASGAVSEATVIDQYNTTLAGILGQPDGSSALQTAMTALSDPSTTAADAQTAFTSFSSTLSDLSSQVQAQRVQADSDIANSMSSVNTLLGQVASLNGQITVAQAGGDDTSALVTQQNEALSSLAGYLNFQTSANSDGSVTVTTTGGTVLVDESFQDTLSHAANASIGATDSLASGTIAGITTADGTDLTGCITGGSLAALIDIRDVRLPDLQSQFDTLAQATQTQANNLSNQAASAGLSTATGSRTFLFPDTQTISESNGATLLSVNNSDGTTQATTTLSQMMQSYQLANGETVSNSWSISDVATAMNNWINTSLGTTGNTYAAINANGNFSVTMPTGGATLAVEDRSGIAYQSQEVADPTAALGQSGTLSFTDNYGNLYSVSVGAGDSLNDIATNLSGVSGLAAQVVTSADGSSELLVGSTNGVDLQVTPTSDNAALLSTLGLIPGASTDGTTTNATIGLNTDGQGSTLTSISVPDPTAALGISGAITVQDQNGNQITYTADTGDSLNSVAANINANTATTGLTATVVSTGNQWALQITGQPGQSLSSSGEGAAGLALNPPPDESDSGFSAFLGLNDAVSGGSPSIYDSNTLSSKFTTLTPTTLTIADAADTGSSGLTMSFAAGQSMSSIAAAINAQTVDGNGNPWLTATVVPDGTGQKLMLTQADGAPMSVTGSLAGQLGIAQSAVGESNNLAANSNVTEPLTGLDYSMALGTSLTIPTAGGINLSGTLLDAGTSIVSANATTASTSQADLPYWETVLNALTSQLEGSSGGGVDLDSQSATLSTYQQAYQQSRMIAASVSLMQQAFAAQTT